MAPLRPGTAAPAVDGVDLASPPTALLFYKTTCPVCRMAAPKAQVFSAAYPGRIVGVGEDRLDQLASFAGGLGVEFGSVPDLPPYPASDAYGIEVVPTLFVIDAGGTIVETVESWDREEWNRASGTMAELTGSAYVPVSTAEDGLPAFRPG